MLCVLLFVTTVTAPLSSEARKRHTTLSSGTRPLSTTPLSVTRPPLTLLPGAKKKDIIADEAFCKHLRPPGYEWLPNNETYFPFDLRSFWNKPDKVEICLINEYGIPWRGCLMQVRHKDIPIGTFDFGQESLCPIEEAHINCPPGRRVISTLHN